MQKINIENAQQDNYQVRESYRNLRTNIFLSGKDTKVVMFTSCGPNEGKSTVTMNLASSIADGGKKVLFIDCDLRKSVLVGRYRVKKGIKGLTHFLSGQNTLEEVIYSTNVENMDVILADLCHLIQQSFLTVLYLRIQLRKCVKSMTMS